MKSFRLLYAGCALALIFGLFPAPAPAEAGPHPGPDNPSAAPLSPAATGAAAEPFSGGPSFDSGWLDIAAGATLTLTHNLSAFTSHLFVDLQCRALANPSGVSSRFMGGVDFGTQPLDGGPGDRMGAFWHNLTITQVRVTRQPEDTLVSQVRIRIWRMPSDADYTSEWTPIPTGGTVFYHSLGGSSDDYLVDLVFFDADGPWGVNQRALGGRDLGIKSGLDNARVGAFWYALTGDSLRVYRQTEDPFADQVLVRVWVRPQATYDSGWEPLTPGSASFIYHGTNGPADDMLVDMQFKSSDAPTYAVNQAYAGGSDLGAAPPPGLAENDRVGAYWYGLNNRTIAVYRRPEDIFANQVRVRIWNFWTPTQASYDSGWQAIPQNAAHLFVHNLSTSPYDVLVDLQFKSITQPSIGINQAAYGGLDEPDGDILGADWRLLNNSSVSVFRRRDDFLAEQVRLRLWQMPQPAYESSLTAINPGQSLVFTHNLGGSPSDYLVNVQFFSGSFGFNQACYGGLDHGPADASDDQRIGGSWHSLTETSISVTRQLEDVFMDHVQVRIWLVAQPAYNSGWISIAAGTGVALSLSPLAHPPADYFVNVMFKNPTTLFNQQYYGSNVLGAGAGSHEFERVGAYWRSLDSDSITLYRTINDTYADHMQARIWVVQQQVYIPLIKK